MKKQILVLVLGLGLAVSACAKNPAPVVNPSADPILKAATQAGATVSAVQSAELAYYLSGSSHISAADQATVQKVFADTSATVLTALNTYSAAKTAPNKTALVNAIVAGVNSIVASLGHLSDSQMATYTAWVSTAVALIDIAVSAPGVGGV